MSDLVALKNIGPAMERWLLKAEITSAKQLKTMGAVEAYIRIKPHMEYANRMALYALYGAIHDLDCMKLDPDVKAMLTEMLAE